MIKRSAIVAAAVLLVLIAMSVWGNAALAVFAIVEIVGLVIIAAFAWDWVLQGRENIEQARREDNRRKARIG